MKSMPRVRRFERLTWSMLFGVSYSVLFLSIGVGTIGATVFPPENDFRVTTVFLVRHAEKAANPPEDPPLLEAGNIRSQVLAHILGKAGIKAIRSSNNR